MTRLSQPQAALRASKTILRTTGQSSQVQRLVPVASIASSANTATAASSVNQQQLRHLSSSSTSRSAEQSHGEHESHFDPPTGWLWGVPPDQKPAREPWERLWYIGFYGTLIAAAVAYAFKPDTSIDTWALEEAKRRLQAEGILPEEEED